MGKVKADRRILIKIFSDKDEIWTVVFEIIEQGQCSAFLRKQTFERQGSTNFHWSWISNLVFNNQVFL